MRRRALGRIVGGVAVCLALGAAAPDGEAHYQTLLAAAKAGSAPVDWQALRFAAMDRPAFGGSSGNSAERKAMFAARARGDWGACAVASGKVVAQNYVDFAAHVIAATCQQQIGRLTSVEREVDVARGLIDAIETGDGLSAAHPFTPIAVYEEYDLMALRRRTVERQSLVNQDGHVFDVLDTTDSKGEKIKYWFIIDRLMAAEAGAFGFKTP